MNYKINIIVKVTYRRIENKLMFDLLNLSYTDPTRMYNNPPGHHLLASIANHASDY